MDATFDGLGNVEIYIYISIYISMSILLHSPEVLVWLDPHVLRQPGIFQGHGGGDTIQRDEWHTARVT